MIQIRRVFTHVEEIRHEFGPAAEVPLLRGAIGAVLTNRPRYRKAYERSGALRTWSWQLQSVPLLDMYARLLGSRTPSPEAAARDRSVPVQA